MLPRISIDGSRKTEIISIERPIIFWKRIQILQHNPSKFLRL